MRNITPAAEPLTRESLYDAVWRTPMRSLASRYGCSDRGLAKLCERYRIPVPTRGFWARVTAGHRLTRDPLPAMSAEELSALGPVTLPVPSPRKPAPKSAAASVASELAAERQQEATGEKASAKAVAPSVEVKATLRSAHPLVQRTKEAFDRAWEDERHILHPDVARGEPSRGLAIHVSKASVSRALRIADALVKAIEGRGWALRCPAKSERRGTGVLLLGEEVPIAIEEKVKRVDRRKEPRRVTRGLNYDAGYGPYHTILVDPLTKYDYKPLGVLQLRIVRSYGSPEMQLADGATQRLEELLGDFVVGVVVAAERRQERTRRWAEEERLRREAAERQAQEERQRLAEAAKVTALEQAVAAWHKANAIRAYVASARAHDPACSEERSAYLEWALRHADRIDPLCPET